MDQELWTVRFEAFKPPACFSRMLLFACCSVIFFACSIPNLENSQCAEARDVVKRLYSFHFANDLKFNKENLRLREAYLSDQLKRDLGARPDGPFDYFTQTDDYPKAFRIGKCEAVNPESTVFDVLVFWRTDTRSEEKHIRVETAKEGGKWLISSVGG